VTLLPEDWVTSTYSVWPLSQPPAIWISLSSSPAYGCAIELSFLVIVRVDL
jgi:hypothetical protein